MALSGDDTDTAPDHEPMHPRPPGHPLFELRDSGLRDLELRAPEWRAPCGTLGMSDSARLAAKFLLIPSITVECDLKHIKSISNDTINAGGISTAQARGAQY